MLAPKFYISVYQIHLIFMNLADNYREVRGLDKLALADLTIGVELSIIILLTV